MVYIKITLTYQLSSNMVSEKENKDNGDSA